METIAKVTISIQKREAIGKLRGKCPNIYAHIPARPSKPKILWARAGEQKSQKPRAGVTLREADIEDAAVKQAISLMYIIRHENKRFI